jgi:hypothetical protein
MESIDMLSYLGLKFKLNKSLGMTRDLSRKSDSLCENYIMAQMRDKIVINGKIAFKITKRPISPT